MFTFKVIRKHTSCLSRQVHEAVRIIRSGGTVINNKEEYSRCSIPTWYPQSLNQAALTKSHPHKHK